MENDWKTLAHGYSTESTQLELSNEYQTGQGLDGFQKSFHPCALDKSSHGIGQVNLLMLSLRGGLLDAACSEPHLIACPLVAMQETTRSMMINGDNMNYSLKRI